MVKETNYINIQGWMVTDLKLSGNALMLYALIYGFCQDGESKFTGSIKYICSWLSVSRPTAIKALKDLVSKRLIEKEVVTISGVNFNHYKTLGVVKKLNGGSKETLLVGSKKTLPYNTIINNKEDNYTDVQKTTFANFKKFISEKASNVSRMKEPFMIDQFLKLKEDYSTEQIKEMVLKMHNYKPLLKKNNSAYLTFLNWAAREYTIADAETPKEKSTIDRIKEAWNKKEATR